MEFSGRVVVWGRLRNSMCAQTTQIKDYIMKDKLLPRSGLDFGAMMDEIDDQKDLKSIAAGQGLGLSSKALVVVLGVFELLLVVVGVVVFYWMKAKFTYTSYDDLYVEHIGNPDLQL